MGLEFCTVLSAFMVVSSIDAAFAASSVDPPSHMPANAAMLLAARKYMTRSPSRTAAGRHTSSSQYSHDSSMSRTKTPGRKSGSRAW